MAGNAFPAGDHRQASNFFIITVHPNHQSWQEWAIYTAAPAPPEYVTNRRRNHIIGCWGQLEHSSNGVHVQLLVRFDRAYVRKVAMQNWARWMSTISGNVLDASRCGSWKPVLGTPDKCYAYCTDKRKRSIADPADDCSLAYYWGIWMINAVHEGGDGVHRVSTRIFMFGEAFTNDQLIVSAQVEAQTALADNLPLTDAQLAAGTSSTPSPRVPVVTAGPTPLPRGVPVVSARAPAVSEVQQVADYVRAEKPTFTSLMLKFPKLARDKEAILRKWHMAFMPPRDSRTKMYYVYGLAGSGKTTAVNELFPGAYWVGQPQGDTNVWWDGFDGEEITVIDEAETVMKPNEIKRMGDRSPMYVPVKHGMMPYRGSTVVLMSNYPPSRIAGKGADKAAVLRRFDKIIKATRNSDNSVSFREEYNPAAANQRPITNYDSLAHDLSLVINPPPGVIPETPNDGEDGRDGFEEEEVEEEVGAYDAVEDPEEFDAEREEAREGAE